MTVLSLHLTTALVLTVLAVGCGGQPALKEETALPGKTIEEVLAAHTDSFMALPGVVGTAIGVCDGTPCIRVFLADSSEAVRRNIPQQLDGYQVRTDVTGEIRPRR
jgi:hypothetical protein